MTVSRIIDACVAEHVSACARSVHSNRI